jgi:hypothetical protein
MKFKFVLASVAFLLTTSYAFADAHFGRFAFAVDGSSEVQDKFAPDTPKIVLHVETIDIKAGQKLTAVWIAEKTKVADPNYKIDSVDTASEGASEAAFALSKPNSGWPAGVYRVDLLIDDKPAISAHFQVVE